MANELLSERLLKPAAGLVVKPLLLRYLRRARPTRYLELDLQVPAGVFHPAFFFSSRCFARWLSKQPLAHLRVLDLGSGSGLLSLVCARKGAVVTAVDINPEAVRATAENARRNRLQINCKLSNLFSTVADQPFDLVVANPPYFQGAPKGAAGRAWHAGPAFEYFKALFAHLGAALETSPHHIGDALMILADNCDIDTISRIAAEHGLRLKCIHTERVLWEQQFIFRVARAP